MNFKVINLIIVFTFYVYAFATIYNYNSNFISITNFTTIAVLRPNDKYIKVNIICSGYIDLRMVDLTNYRLMLDNDLYYMSALINADNIQNFHIDTKMNIDKTYLIIAIDKNTIFYNQIISKIMVEDECSITNTNASPIVILLVFIFLALILLIIVLCPLLPK